MAVKPDIEDARWAEEADGTPSAELTEPTSGKKDVGWVDAELPPHEYFNWLANAIYQWAKYLSDGDFTGAHSFLGTVGITGELDVDGDVDSTGDVFFGAVHVLSIPAAAFSGVGSTSTVDTWVFSQVTNGSFDGPHWEKIAATDVWISAPVVLDAGSEISDVRVTFDRNAETLVARLVEINVTTGARTVVNTVTDTTSSGRNVNLSVWTGIPYATMADHWYVIEVDADNSGSAVFGAQVSWSRPS